MESMCREMGSARGLQVDQELSVLESFPATERLVLQETVSYRFPVAFRSEFTSAAGRHIQILFGGRALTVVDRRIVAEAANDLDHYKDIFLYNTPDLLKNRLVDLGVAVEVSSLGRFQGRIGYVLGAQYPDESVPQLWLDKETFRPMRWLLKPAAATPAGAALEVRYDDWKKVASLWYPRRIEFYQGDRILRRIQVKRARVNPDFPDRFFDLAYLESLYPYAAAAPSDRKESGAVTDMQRAIDRFRRMIE